MLICEGINMSGPKYPLCLVDENRAESLETWPDYEPVKKGDLVEAAMVYTGVGDSVRCYFCGGGIRNWERDDIPMEKHARWCPNCKTILSVQYQGYTDTSSQGRTEGGFSSDYVREVGSQNNPLESVAAQSCLEMDFPKESVKQAIDIFCQRNGDLNFKAKDLCEILFEIEESQEKPDLIVAIASPELVIDKDEDIPVQFDSLTRENTCKMCMHNQEHMTLLAYNHLVSCPQCAPVLPILQELLYRSSREFHSTTY